MSPPNCSLRLIKRHIGERRTSRTTLIVTLYLIANILGRLSVALFGLAFNIKDEKGIDYPILATNWSSALWTGNFYPSTAGPADYEIVEGKDTGTQYCSNELILTCLKRFLEFGLEWIAEVHQDQWARLGLQQ